MLAIARVIGETAPLLVTVGLTTGLNFNPFPGRMATLPVFAFNSYDQRPACRGSPSSTARGRPRSSSSSSFWR